LQRKISAAQIRKVLGKRTEASKGIVTMSDMAFLPQMLVINVGEKVVWRNTAAVTHNVVADPGKAVFSMDVKLPAGVGPFASSELLSGQSYSHTFTTIGIYRYVCTLHETTGMKGVIVVEGPQALRASK
jgi:plastocyanin